MGFSRDADGGQEAADLWCGGKAFGENDKIDRTRRAARAVVTSNLGNCRSGVQLSACRVRHESVVNGRRRLFGDKGPEQSAAALQAEPNAAITGKGGCLNGADNTCPPKFRAARSRG
ncbi:hypothetical protein ANO11243_083620 [Dothideomycetidae sp. 11243]|nr:hypothetical protein ANO11243_083620 [fungal sp. No.11243]